MVQAESLGCLVLEEPHGLLIRPALDGRRLKAIHEHEARGVAKATTKILA